MAQLGMGFPGPLRNEAKLGHSTGAAPLRLSSGSPFRFGFNAVPDYTLEMGEYERGGSARHHWPAFREQGLNLALLRRHGHRTYRWLKRTVIFFRLHPSEAPQLKWVLSYRVIPCLCART